MTTKKSSKRSQKKIGKLIAELREKRGFTQKALAEKLQTSQSAIARMEKGEQNFSTDMLIKIGNVLKRDIINLSGDAMDFRIRGGKKLSGTVITNTSKNAAVGLLCASLLNKGTTVLRNMPHIAEVERIIEVLESIGVTVQWINEHDVSIVAPEQYNLKKLDLEAARKTRSIIMFLGPLIHFFDKFSLPQAGGCRLGKRTVRPHFYALENFGVDIKTTEESYEVSVGKLHTEEVVLYEAGDTVTENAIMAASLIPGKTVIKFASANYQVQDLCYFLQKLGVEIEGIGSTTLTIHGVESISTKVEYHISEDPIESMFFLAVAATTGSTLTIKRCPIDFLQLELLRLEKMGFKYKVLDRYKGENGHVNLVDIKTLPSQLVASEEKIEARPYPGLNIDNLPFFVPIATQAKGRTLIHDWVYEDRVKFFVEMNKIGADVVLGDLHRAFIYGPTELHAARVVCPPALRPAAIILIGMLAAKGESVLKNVYSINRGYEDLAHRLKKLGADIDILREM